MTAILLWGYRWYSARLAANYALDDTRVTPAHVHNDGVDYVPTQPFYLFGQHFSAIAAAGPIAGPILACQLFGWGPCLVWIAVGSIFIGAVHDFSSLVASVRHDARSVAEIVRQHLGRRGWLAMMGFIWLALIYVIVAFTDITANTFVGKSEELDGGAFTFNPGGAVAAASTMYLVLALTMGLVTRWLAPRLSLLTALFVPATLFVIWLGTRVSTVFVFDSATPTQVWGGIIIVYCFIASLMPMWMLLQPRGYLGGFVLYATLAVGAVGVLFGALRFPTDFDIEQPIFRSFDAGGDLGMLFPFLFVTIACGACSGFHGLVCSGTTSKQIERETHTRSVGYGAMLLEAFVAVIALATVMTVVPQSPMPPPGKIFGDGIGRSLAVLIGPDHLVFARTFGAMAFSTFVFDTLDVATRLGRYIVEEVTGIKGRVGAVVATAATLMPPAVVLLTVPPPGPGQRPAYLDFWTLFGTSNQLLAGLTLLGITVWLYAARKRVRYTLVPLVFILAVTLVALGFQVRYVLAALVERGLTLPMLVNGVVATSLFAISIMLIVDSWRAVRRIRAERLGAATPTG